MARRNFHGETCADVYSPARLDARALHSVQVDASIAIMRPNRNPGVGVQFDHPQLHVPTLFAAAEGRRLAGDKRGRH